MKVAICQINTTIGDFEGNLEKVASYVDRAAADGVDLAVFPEMCLCGYPPNDLLDQEAFSFENLKAMRSLQSRIPRGIAVAVGYVERNRSGAGKALQNSVAVIKDGKLIVDQAKTLLPTYDVFDEARYFEPAATREIFELADERIGIAVCEDIWFETEPGPGSRHPVDPVKDLLDLGATVIIAPSASPFYSGKAQVRKSLLSRIGRSSGVPVIYVNMVGGNDNLVFDGHSLMTDIDGNLVVEGKAFDEDYLVVDTKNTPPARQLKIDKMGEIEQALILGVRDYLRKCGFTKVCLGLSGGIDSALVAVIAAKALGPENVMAFSMPSRYSSDGSRSDAEQLAENTGIGYATLPIESLFTEHCEVLAEQFSGTEAGLAEENLQARIRGTLLMAYSNKFSALVLTTGNKSELATGYCTLYGDMCGALSVIGDLLKTEVYALCEYINRSEEVIPIAILEKPPSAELRPDQTDQDSLPPYDVLDNILTHYLLENRTLEELVELGFERELVSEIIRLVGRAEYKRRQAAPVLKVSTRAFGSGRRMPIARVIYEA